MMNAKNSPNSIAVMQTPGAATATALVGFCAFLNLCCLRALSKLNIVKAVDDWKPFRIRCPIARSQGKERLRSRRLSRL